MVDWLARGNVRQASEKRETAGKTTNLSSFFFFRLLSAFTF
jgi:hypothetical protein